MTAQTKRASTADAVRLLEKIDELEADMNGLQAQFVAKLEEYTALLDRMRSSPLWPDTVAELRAQVEASDSVPVAHLLERANASNGVQLCRRGNR